MARMETRFSEWLVRQLQDRGWSQRELARRSDISHTTVSEVLGNVRRPTWDFCASIAGALGENPDAVFVRAGLKEPLPEPVTEETEVVGLMRVLDVQLRAAALAMLRGLAGDSTATAGAEVYRVQDDLEVELLEAFRQLSPRWREVFLEDARRAAQMGLVRMVGEEGHEDDQEAD